MTNLIHILISLFCTFNMILAIKLATMWKPDDSVGEVDIIEYDDYDEIYDIATEGIDGMKWGIAHYNVNDICASIASLIATLNGLCIVLTIVGSIM